jgi:coenzyme F420-0:L-glutamate ligase/coenzyme F420-1:gamma-L-glutamate ligase
MDAPGARTLVRSVDEDMFRFGSAEAYQLGYQAARAELRELPERTATQDDSVNKD